MEQQNNNKEIEKAINNIKDMKEEMFKKQEELTELQRDINSITLLADSVKARENELRTDLNNINSDKEVNRKIFFTH
jgi:predicted  nucleic acid-binding Zn-ribbon protein